MSRTASDDLRAALATLGCFAFAFNAATVLHESGHVLAALLTGARVRGFAIHPFGSSSVWIDPDPWPAVTHAGGAAFACAAALAWVASSWPWRSPGIWALGHATAVAVLGTSGIDLAVGAFLLEGDGGALVNLGAPRWLLVAVGAALAAAAVSAGVALLPLLGVAPNAPLARRVLVALAGILPYLAGIVAVQARTDPSLLQVWIPMVAAGALAVAGMAALAGRAGGDAGALTWSQAGLLLAAGTVTVAALSWSFR